MLGWLRERAGVRQVMVALAVFAVGSAALLGGPYLAFLKESGTYSLETRFLYGPRDALAHIGRFDDAGREFYAWWLRWDLLYPLIYAPALATALGVSSWRATRREWLLRAAVFVPLAAGVIDWIEDGALLALISAHPQAPLGIATLAAIATAVKMVLVYGSLIALAPALIAWAVVSRRERSVVDQAARKGPAAASGGETNR
jgi:hypothetical protein